jgi:hypothetical protein
MVDHENASKTADKPSLIHLIVTATLPVSILKRLAAFGCLFRAKIDFSVYFAHLFLMGAKNVATALPASTASEGNKDSTLLFFCALYSSHCPAAAAPFLVGG